MAVPYLHVMHHSAIEFFLNYMFGGNSVQQAIQIVLSLVLLYCRCVRSLLVSIYTYN